MILSDEDDSNHSLQFNIREPEFSEEQELPKSEQTIFKAGDLAVKTVTSDGSTRLVFIVFKAGLPSWFP
jgi:hypothetical protein